MITLFGHEDSGHAFKVAAFLNFANIPYTYYWVDIFASRESRPEQFRANARFHEVPLLLDDNRAFTQSGAILLHLATKEQKYGAENEQSLARCREWLMWEANKIGMCLPQLRSRYHFNDESINDGAQEWLLARYQHDVNLLNAELSDGRSWIIPGKHPSIVDFALCGYLLLASEANVEVPEQVTTWLDRLCALPRWASHTALLSESAQIVK